MHFAALAYVGESVDQPNIYYRTNVAGTLSLLDAMVNHGIKRLIFSSTCATYGIPETVPISEAARQKPVSPYGRSKLMVEEILRDYCAAFPLAAVALRYFNAAGADMDGELGEEHDPEPHLAPIVLQAALGLRPHVDIYGEDYDTPDGTCVRDYIHVADLARAHVAALALTEANGFVAFNLGVGQGASVMAVIEAARRITGCPIEVKSGPRRAGDPPVLVADAGLARAALGWSPEHGDLDAMLGSAWRWMREHRQKAGLGN
jgi:UDP-arabinose 4-epimerase